MSGAIGREHPGDHSSRGRRGPGFGWPGLWPSGTGIRGIWPVSDGLFLRCGGRACDCKRPLPPLAPVRWIGASHPKTPLRTESNPPWPSSVDWHKGQASQACSCDRLTPIEGKIYNRRFHFTGSRSRPVLCTGRILTPLVVAHPGRPREIILCCELNRKP